MRIKVFVLQNEWRLPKPIYVPRSSTQCIYMKFMTASKRHAKKTSRRLLCNTKWHFGDKAVCAHEADRSTRQSVFCHICSFFLLLLTLLLHTRRCGNCGSSFSFHRHCVSKQTRFGTMSMQINRTKWWVSAKQNVRVKCKNDSRCLCTRGQKDRKPCDCRRWATMRTKLRRKT